MPQQRLISTPGYLVRSAVLCALVGLGALAGSQAGAEPVPDPAASSSDYSDSPLKEITVTAQRLGLLGTAATASEGVVTDQEIQLTPAYRPGQLLETVPGLIVTLHSGEGKANQYLLRGYNLDHGTDLETYVDAMPVNQPTHAHGQGYTDLNFMIPELADAIAYTKGPYYADVGDFGAVGSVRISYRDTIPDQISVTAGSFGFQRIFAAGSTPIANGNLLAAIEGQHYDGPFDNPDDARKGNFVLRYSEGDSASGYSLTGMYYHQLWTNTTDIPLRAISEGVVPDRFATLDPTDGGRTQRASLSAEFHTSVGAGQFTAGAFYIRNDLNIYNDFTHYLTDPLYGDQEDQFERRDSGGGKASYSLPLMLFSVPSEVTVGGLTRYDALLVGRAPSVGMTDLSALTAPPSFSDLDQVYLFSGAAYLQAVSHWTATFRSVLGFREDYQHGTDIDYLAALHTTAGYNNGGTVHQTLPQPKASLIYAPKDSLEFYLSAGRGFHSADIRGVNQDTSVDLGLPHTPLLAKQEGQEIGMRVTPARNVTFTFAVYNLWQQSETIIDPDIGADSAGPPSRRYGYELNVTYKINQWLEFYGSYSGDHTRFTRPFDDGTGHLGDYITDAPVATGSLALFVSDLGRWSGAMQVRYLGDYPLSSGPCVDSAAVHDFAGVATSCANAPTALGQVNGKGFAELNLDVAYALPSNWSAAIGIYNILNTNAAAAEFWYVDRLQSEIGTYPDGRADIHEHPLEPLMVRLTVTKKFGR